MTMESRQSRASLITFLVVLIIFLSSFLVMISPYLMAVVMGGILALLAAPSYRRLRARRMRPRTAGLVVTLSVIVLVVAPIAVFATLATKQGMTVTQLVVNSPEFSLQSVLSKVSHYGPIEMLGGDSAQIEAQLGDVIQNLGRSATTIVLALAKSIPDVILNLFLASIACYFFLLDGPRFIRWLLDKIPLEADVRSKLTAAFKDTAISVVWASMAASGTQAVVMVVAFAVLGVPGAFLAGGVTFILSWIPVLGSTPVWLVGCLYLYVKGSLWRVAVMVGFGILTGLVDNFVRPYVLKGRGEMHPLLSLVAIFGGIQMFGLFGVFFGPILAAVVVSMLQIWPVVGGRFGLRFNK